MRSVFILIFTVLLLVGCSYKHDTLYVSSKKTTEQGVANTKKTQFTQNGNAKIFVTVTYLNSLKVTKDIDKTKEQFVVGFHFVNIDSKSVEQKLSPKDIKFEIENQIHLLKVKKLSINSTLLKTVPASNPWSQYFLVQTPKIDKNIINFSLKLKDYPKISLNFEKDY